MCVYPTCSGDCDHLRVATIGFSHALVVSKRFALLKLPIKALIIFFVEEFPYLPNPPNRYSSCQQLCHL